MTNNDLLITLKNYYNLFRSIINKYIKTSKFNDIFENINIDAPDWESSYIQNNISQLISGQIKNCNFIFGEFEFKDVYDYDQVGYEYITDIVEKLNQKIIDKDIFEFRSFDDGSHFEIILNCKSIETEEIRNIKSKLRTIIENIKNQFKKFLESRIQEYPFLFDIVDFEDKYNYNEMWINGLIYDKYSSVYFVLANVDLTLDKSSFKGDPYKKRIIKNLINEFQNTFENMKIILDLDRAINFGTIRFLYRRKDFLQLYNEHIENNKLYTINISEQNLEIIKQLLKNFILN